MKLYCHRTQSWLVSMDVVRRMCYMLDRYHDDVLYRTQAQLVCPKLSAVPWVDCFFLKLSVNCSFQLNVIIFWQHSRDLQKQQQQNKTFHSLLLTWASDHLWVVSVSFECHLFMRKSCFSQEISLHNSITTDHFIKKPLSLNLCQLQSKEMENFRIYTIINHHLKA